MLKKILIGAAVVVKPLAATSLAEFTFKPEGSQTVVTCIRSPKET